ncbi:Leucine-responsive regulatory protein [Aliiroseovarius sp. xm-m-379]|uniref:AsnC family transcriptional regulator n=1 Tax=Aliiroseovarius crassostreae TaxID=154981 RepID=A0A0P7IIN8_9RHOB|nr:MULTISPECIES: Lrp/AsnC family transcriptional regulator [Aliiroseovarius]KPN63680.1 AsnC family transcriptional regulator [Aliiroseovarius crassostreae]NRP13913.1 Leucine-responsive regulatory protein [Aliiroseovarius sp. xm-d-517]NRP25442.1 Leucine-responsive regulatory protein [Aliiroseovarius sp. xm-m-379]NRP29434.1 Leucine-responsive regulatory protein [Aliiroseovarius sp. xm-m-314]NRP34241.1 Leucine-responsive regulatory protein [Aliiroseovarius sp. xm-a-104]
MDATDRRIISALQQNGRQKLGDLAEEVGLSPTPCARRVAALEDSGVITGYGARVDQARLGLPVTVFIEVELESQKREAISAFERAISRMEEVMECHLMSGSRDILLRVVVADLASFDAFMENHLMRVEGVSRMRSSFTLRTMVRRNRLPMG